MMIDYGGTPETVTISALGTAPGSAGTLVLPAAAGDTTINVSTISGAVVGHQYRVDTGPNIELGTVATVGTAAGTAGTLPIGAGAGDTTIFVSTISGATVGQKYRVDAPPNLEAATVATVGTAAGTAGTLPIGASVGDTTIYVSTISGAAAGHKYKVDAPPNMEVPTIATVGTAAATATTLPAGASAGDTNIKVASVTGMTAGHKIRVDTGATIEVGTVATVGTAAASATTLAAASNVGDTNIKVASVTGMTAGHKIRVDTGASIEIGTIQTVGTSGAGGTGVDLAAPLTLAHASGAGAQDLGTGVDPDRSAGGRPRGRRGGPGPRHRHHADGAADGSARDRRRDPGSRHRHHAVGSAGQRPRGGRGDPGGRHGHHARGSADRRARIRRRGPGPRHRRDVHARADRRAPVRRVRGVPHGDAGVRLVERGPARDQRRDVRRRATRRR